MTAGKESHLCEKTAIDVLLLDRYGGPSLLGAFSPGSVVGFATERLKSRPRTQNRSPNKILYTQLNKANLHPLSSV